VLPNGRKFPIGPFRIEQDTSGRTFLYCERSVQLAFRAGFRNLASFQGQTTGGHTVLTHGGLGEYIDTPKEFCFIVRNVEEGQTMPDGQIHDLSLTNLRFQTDGSGFIAFTVPWDGATIPVRLIPRRNYQERIRQLTKTQGIVPTATLRFHAAGLTGQALSEFITDLCLALSIVQGRKVNWIYRATYGPRPGFPARRIRGNHHQSGHDTAVVLRSNNTRGRYSRTDGGEGRPPGHQTLPGNLRPV
jgi:hypothetical protein